MNCENLVNHFCIVCGNYFPSGFLENLTTNLLSSYDECFGLSSQDFIDNSWVPNSICRTCQSSLSYWKSGVRSKQPFFSPMIWREPRNHENDCFFCANKHFLGASKKTKINLRYTLTESVTMPVPIEPSNNHEEPEIVMEIDEVVEETMDLVEEDADGTTNSEDDDEEMVTNDVCSGCQSSKFDQAELNDLVRDLGLSKAGAELLASRLKEKRCLKKKTKITFYRDRDKEFRQYFSKDGSLVFCHDIPGLMKEVGVAEYSSEQWRLFIDSSKASLKAVLLNNGNELASIPIAHSTVLGETYENLAFLLKKVKYSDHRWKVCTDLKVVTIILGQQTGFTKFMCFLCLWDSRARHLHYLEKEWPQRNEFLVGKNNIIKEPLVDPADIILPPLHIQLGLFKQYVKALKVRESPAFQYLFQKFPKLSEAKIKEGVFDGPQIRQLMRDQEFSNNMSEDEIKAWNNFIELKKNFFGNFKAQNHKQLVENLVESFEKIGCLMSLKLHFMDSHADRFPANVGDFSEEQGERFHQDLKDMEKRYQGVWDIHMMSDYCWNLARDTVKSHKRKGTRRSLFQTCKPRKL